jgi:hypothetical protein
MPKTHHSSRDIKKKPLLSQKEKRMAKNAKKHSHDTQPPLITPVTTH